MKNSITILMLMFLLSCNNVATHEQNQNALANPFSAFIEKNKIIELPFVYSYNNGESKFNYDEMKTIDSNSSDTLFVKNKDGVKCYGILPDTSKYFSIIYFYPAEVYYPVVVTYSKSGQLIDELRLNLGGCGEDCGLEQCTEFSRIDNDLTIFSADTIKWEFLCDSIGEPIPKSGVIWIDTKSGRFTNEGRFVMTKDKHQEVKYNR